MYGSASGTETTRSPAGTDRMSVPSLPVVPDATTSRPRWTSIDRDTGPVRHGSMSGLNTPAQTVSIVVISSRVAAGFGAHETNRTNSPQTNSAWTFDITTPN